jgi:hypothetical protein
MQVADIGGNDDYGSRALSGRIGREPGKPDFSPANDLGWVSEGITPSTNARLPIRPRRDFQRAAHH